MGRAFFVTGTGTDVGKTFFSSLFLAKYAEKYNFRYWKPIQTGLSESSDTELIKKLTNLSPDFFCKPLYEYQTPASPHFAAKKENLELNPKYVTNEIKKIRDQNVLIEGAGGIFVPWTTDYLSLQGIKESNLEVVVIVSSELGTINHSLMTLDILLNRFVPVVGFYMVGPQNELLEDNSLTIQKFSGVTFLGNTCFPSQKLAPTDFKKFAELEFDVGRNVIENLLSPSDDFEST